MVFRAIIDGRWAFAAFVKERVTFATTDAVKKDKIPINFLQLIKFAHEKKKKKKKRKEKAVKRKILS